jgi:hypothetical protein
VSGIYVNFSDDEAASESRDFEPLPTGKYLVTITNCELAECGPESKNPGKPYYKFEFTVSADKRGGMYFDRKCWTNAMCFSPALFTITHIMKAVGINVVAGQFEIPEADYFVGLELVVGGVLIGETTDKRDPSKKYPPKFEPKSFFPKAVWTAPVAGGSGAKAGASKASSLLS